jgi:ubiquinone/menaquinone biosynthesis C-methylase UbiE
MKTPETIQQEYYRATAHQYDALHMEEDREHNVALKYVSGLIGSLGISSILDVGCGTGRAMKHFIKCNPTVKVHGIEPVEELIEQAVHNNLVPSSAITRAFGQALPFANSSFDATCEFGVLHHVKEPNLVVQEMMRVSRKAIFLSDENRFARGGIHSKLAKLALYKLGIFHGAYYLKTFGRGYRFSEGDGLAYSYSVFDSFEILSQWADRIILIPTNSEKPPSWLHPLLTSFHVLLCAVRDS